MKNHRFEVQGKRVFIWIGKAASHEDLRDSFGLLVAHCHTHIGVEIFADMRQAKDPDPELRKMIRDLLAFNDVVLNESITKWAILLPSKLHIRFITALSWGVKKPKYGQKVFFNEYEALDYLDGYSRDLHV